MNELYISGKIVNLPQCNFLPATDFFCFMLQTTFLDPSNQIAIHNFVVSTCNQTAKWATQNLHLGDEILIKGTLNSIQIEDTASTVISALRIIIIQHASNNE